MNFSNRLDQAIKEGFADGVPQPLNQAADMAHRHKAALEFERAADRAFSGLADVVRALKVGGLEKNESTSQIFEQLSSLAEGLRKGGSMRQTLQAVLTLPAK